MFYWLMYSNGTWNLPRYDANIKLYLAELAILGILYSGANPVPTIVKAAEITEEYRKILEAVNSIPASVKQNFKCVEFAEKLTQGLNCAGINYQIVRVTSNFGVYSDKAGQSIGDGFHYGIKVGEMVFDNLTAGGMEFTAWLTDLGIGSTPESLIWWNYVTEILNR